LTIGFENVWSDRSNDFPGLNVKVQIIYLDAEDDHISAREKLRWTKAQRVVFVWPGRGRVLSRRLDLKLLQRQAEHQGAQIGLVTHDPDTIHNAAELGVPVFENVDQIEGGRWHVRPQKPSAFRPPASPEQDSRHAPQPSMLRSGHPLPNFVRYSFFIAGILLPLAAVLALTPNATITLAPPTEIKQVQTSFELITDSSLAPKRGQLTVRQVTAQVSGSLRAATTSTSSQPEDPAVGAVLVTNVTTSTVTLDSGSRLIPLDHSGPAFETLSRVVLLPEASNTVQIQAVEPGPAGNLPAETAWAIEGPAGLSLEALNPEPTSGGSLASRSSVSTSDRTTARAQLESQLLQQAQEEIEVSLGQGESLLPDSLTVARVIELSYDHEAGEVADSIGVELTLEIRALSYDNSTLLDLLSMNLTDSIPASWSPVPGSFEAESRTLDSSQSSILHVSYQGLVYPKPDRLAIARSLRLVPVRDLEQVLSTSPDPVHLLSYILTPKWLPFFPAFTFQFQVSLPWEVPS
jgi:hypothetical protein